MNRIAVAAVVAVGALAAPAARAQFQGRLEYTIQRSGAAPSARSQGGAGTGAGTAEAAEKAGRAGSAVLWISPDGARTELALPEREALPGGGHVVTIWKRAEPDRVYYLNDARKTFAAVDVHAAESDTSAEQKIARLGPATIAGYRCERARVTDASGRGDEICVTAALGKIPAGLSADRRFARAFDELRKAGLDGVPVSWKGGDGEFSMVLTSAKEQAVPRNLLEIPAGYTKTSMMGTFATPEQQQRMEEGMARLRDRMKNMTPEQRAQMEKMMEQYAK